MKDQLDRIEAKLDKLDERADKVDVQLAEYNAQLKIHIKRNDNFEKKLEHHESHAAKQMEPVLAHINKVNGALKLLASAGIILTIIKVLQLIK